MATPGHITIPVRIEVEPAEPEQSEPEQPARPSWLESNYEGGAQAFHQKLAGMAADTADPAMIAYGATPNPGLNADPDRWRLRIGNLATVIIVEVGTQPGDIWYEVTVEVERAAGQRTVREMIAGRGASYDDAFVAGKNLAHDLIDAYGIIDHAESIVHAATHRAELRLRRAGNGG